MIRYDDPELRRAYVQGARDALETVLIVCPAPLLREIEDWIDRDLECWDGGDPPVPPSRWDEEPN